MSLKSLALGGLLAAAVVTGASADDRYVIVMKGNSIAKNMDAKVAANGGVVVRSLPQVGLVIATSADADFASKMKAVNGVSDAGPVVARMVPDVTSQDYAIEQPDLTGPTAADDLLNAGLVWGVQRVHAPQAWANGHTGSHNTVVAVIDTGVAWNHPDLAPNVVYADCFTSAGSFADGACNPYPSLSDHGTHVAGTVGAAFDGGRVVGVAPNIGIAGYNVFEPIPGCGTCAYSDSRWSAMIDAADRGFQVESMSLGGVGQIGGPGSQDLNAYLQAEKKVANYVKRQGTLMVASAGNEALNVSGTLIHVPGDIPQMVNVSATGIQPQARYPQTPAGFDILAFYSNYGGAVDIAGPGGDCGQIGTCDANRPANWFEYLVLSSTVTPNAACAATASCPVGYGWKGGTSMATPHVSGVAGLVYDANPGITPGEVKDKIKSTAENIGSGIYFGAGMVRADNATN